MEETGTPNSPGTPTSNTGKFIASNATVLSTSTSKVSFFKKLIAAVGRGYKGRSTVSHLIVGVGWKWGSNALL
jgi:hypothetical protein